MNSFQLAQETSRKYSYFHQVTVLEGIFEILKKKRIKIDRINNSKRNLLRLVGLILENLTTRKYCREK